VSPACKKRREEFLVAEKNPGRLMRGSVGDLSPKYRFDTLAMDFGQIGDHLGLSIALADASLPSVMLPTQFPIQPSFADTMFWYAIDNGIRTASSGWDRIALFLELVLHLKIGKLCDFEKVMKCLADDDRYRHNKEFETLDQFRNGAYRQLNNGAGRGLRNEATHLMSTHARYYFEKLEYLVFGELVTDLAPKNILDSLIDQYHHYIIGHAAMLSFIDDAIARG
jgi:hypothetical protein